MVFLFIGSAALFGVGLSFYSKHLPNVEDIASGINGVSASKHKVNINNASIKELTKVKHITPESARRIIEYRNKKGRFHSIDELKRLLSIKAKEQVDLNRFLSVD